MINVLYEDKNLAVVEKPVGFNSQGEGKNSLITVLKDQLNCDIYPIHRLDQVTGGVIVYAKNSQMAGKMSQVLLEDKSEKIYWAVIEGALEEENGTLEDWLYHDKQKNKAFVVKKQRSGVKIARLSYQVVLSNETHSLVEVKLLTGRTHQIRVQFASRGHALAGDGKYGSKDNGCSCALWAHQLTFIHPYTRKTMVFQSSPQWNYPYNMFKEKND